MRIPYVVNYSQLGTGSANNGIIFAINYLLSMEIKRIILFIALVISILGVQSRVYGQGDVISKVKGALNTGSSKELVKYLDKASDIDIEGEKSTFSKTQAEVVLKDFFQNYPPTSFQIIHQGASKAGSPYVIGQYSHKTGSFRVWIRLKELSEDNYVVHAMSFYKD